MEISGSSSLCATPLETSGVARLITLSGSEKAALMTIHSVLNGLESRTEISLIWTAVTTDNSITLVRNMLVLGLVLTRTFLKGKTLLKLAIGVIILRSEVTPTVLLSTP